MGNYSEKRSYIRIQTDSKISYREHGSDQLHYGQCLNLSAGGVLFTSDQRFSPGTLVDITIIPEINLVKPMDATIQVVRSQSRLEGDYAIAGEIKVMG